MYNFANDGHKWMTYGNALITLRHSICFHKNATNMIFFQNKIYISSVYIFYHGQQKVHMSNE